MRTQIVGEGLKAEIPGPLETLSVCVCAVLCMNVSDDLNRLLVVTPQSALTGPRTQLQSRQ